VCAIPKVQEDNRSPVHLANTADYKDVTLYFSTGLHFVSWVYYKEARYSEHESIAKLDVWFAYPLICVCVFECVLLTSM
jgi:hypothetical protein